MLTFGAKNFKARPVVIDIWTFQVKTQTRTSFIHFYLTNFIVVKTNVRINWGIKSLMASIRRLNKHLIWRDSVIFQGPLSADLKLPSWKYPDWGSQIWIFNILETTHTSEGFEDFCERVNFRRWKSFHQCGATLLSSCWAITAAHCYIDPEKTNDVVSLEAAKWVPLINWLKLHSNWVTQFVNWAIGVKNAMGNSLLYR